MTRLCAGLTDVGKKRDHNEDNLLVSPSLDLFAVCDGMGGHACGEVASAIAVNCLERFFEQTVEAPERTWPFKAERSLSDDENRLATAIKLANREIYEAAQRDKKKAGMGTTVVAGVVTEQVATFAHCGDSRAYLLRDGQLAQLTEDHSLLNAYIHECERKNHTVTDEEIASFPHKNVIVRALGLRSEMQVEITRAAPAPGDVFLLCSDGLSGMLPDARIAAVLNLFLRDTAKASDVDGMCKALIREANAAGGDDNITVIVVKL